MATEQRPIWLPVEVLSAIDDLVDRGRYESRIAAVRAGIVALADAEGRRIDDNLIEGYTRTPPTTSENDAALASLRTAIAEEPW